MIFYSLLETLIGKKIAVELRHGMQIEGTLDGIDHFSNLNLEGVKVYPKDKYSYMEKINSTFIRASSIRYIQLPKNYVDLRLLSEATRLEFESNNIE